MKKFIALEIGDKNLNHKVKDIVTVYIPSEEKNYWEIRFTNGEKIITTLPIYLEYTDDETYEKLYYQEYTPCKNESKY